MMDIFNCYEILNAVTDKKTIVTHDMMLILHVYELQESSTHQIYRYFDILMLVFVQNRTNELELLDYLRILRKSFHITLPFVSESNQFEVIFLQTDSPSMIQNNRSVSLDV